MKTITIPATELKRNTAEILNIVAYGNTVAIIERHGEAIAKVVPVVGGNRTKKEWEEILEKSFGSMPNFPEVDKKRYFRKRFVNL
ncbi:MAG: hypothetical protein A2802_00420 [Candidatus Woykebacteria bacterium RIFCSPHIGHO2_01_FULL_43_29]|nr:MAG: hypothetical protein A2802_00420 [Candidatus Woykebacteria bacterium RIFCSPHIGHO2_01_FULL_43_29]